MKTLKYIVGGVVMVVVVTGCIVEHVSTNTYVYKNECSMDITIKSTLRREVWMEMTDTIVVLPVGGSFSGKIVGGSLNPIPWNVPDGRYFRELYQNDNDSTIVSNGTHRIIHRRANNDPLYENECYTLTESTRKERTYLWTFRDEDFIGAEPIVP
ncbi:MAG: hypothetical protein LBH06_08805 [Rikenellaceae bacterium]|jgi:hypothetical protein|nr:hypothetical protein [Rikenellaceae bacterium]